MSDASLERFAPKFFGGSFVRKQHFLPGIAQKKSLINIFTKKKHMAFPFSVLLHNFLAPLHSVKLTVKAPENWGPLEVWRFRTWKPINFRELLLVSGYFSYFSLKNFDLLPLKTSQQNPQRSKVCTVEMRVFCSMKSTTAASSPAPKITSAFEVVWIVSPENEGRST